MIATHWFSITFASLFLALGAWAFVSPTTYQRAARIFGTGRPGAEWLLYEAPAWFIRAVGALAVAIGMCLSLLIATGHGPPF